MKITKILSLIVILFISFTIIAVDAKKNFNPEELIKQASDRFEQKDFMGAMSLLSDGIKKDPKNPQLYLNRGFIYHFLQDYESAMADYNQAILINPNFIYAYNNRGALKVSLNDINGAMEDYATAISINPNYADVYYNRANLEYMLDNYKSALEDYDKAIELNPRDSDAYNNRGVVKKRMDYNVGALSDYSQAIALNPKDSIAYANRGRLKKLYFDNEGASIDLNQAIALAEHQPFIKNVKPLLSNKHYLAAIPSVNTMYTGDLLAQQKPDQTPDLSNEKLVRYTPDNGTKASDVETDKLAEAKQPEVISVNKEPANINNKKSVENTSKKQKKSAQTKQENKIDTPIESQQQVLATGIHRMEMSSQNTPDIRTATVTQPATTNVKLAESYYIRGLQKCILRDLPGAVEDLDKAILYNSKYADAYYYRGAIKKELGDMEGFRQDYSTAIQIEPSLQNYNDSNALSLIVN